MGKGSFAAYIVWLFIFCLAGCASTVTSEFKPKTLKDGQLTAEVVVMRGCAKLTSTYCPAPDGKVETLQLVSEESTWGAIGKGVFMITPYGWATMAAHSGKEAIVTLPAGRVDLEIQHVQRRETSRDYDAGKVVRIHYRQWTWKQVVTAELKAGGEYVLQLPDAKCLVIPENGDVKTRIVTSCVARLLQDDKPVPSAGPPLLASVDTTVAVNEESVDKPVPTASSKQDSMIPESVLRDQQKSSRAILFGTNKK